MFYHFSQSLIYSSISDLPMPRVSFFRNDLPQDIDAMDQDNINRRKIYETNSKEKFSLVLF